MRMLLAEGVFMRAMTAPDWDFLITLCNPEVQQQWAARGSPGSPFSARHMRLRARMDAYLRDYVHDWSVERASDLVTAHGRAQRGWIGDGRVEGRDAWRKAARLVLRAVGPSVRVGLEPVPPPADGRGGREGAGEDGGAGVRVTLSITPACVAASVSVVARFYKDKRRPGGDADGVGRLEAAAVGEGDEDGDMGLRYAKGPDGTRGFAKGTRPRAEAARECWLLAQRGEPAPDAAAEGGVDDAEISAGEALAPGSTAEDEEEPQAADEAIPDTKEPTSAEIGAGPGHDEAAPDEPY